MSYSQLLADLDALTAAGSATDETIVKSMATDGDDNGAEGGDGEGADAVDGAADDAAIAAAAADGEAAGEAADAGEGDDTLGKSFSFQTEDGETVEALDATDLLKALIQRVDATEADGSKLVGGLMDLVKAQGAEIGRLAGEVSRLGSAGRGRKAVVTVAEKPGSADLTKSDPVESGEGITANDFMAKAMGAFNEGKLTGQDVARCESYLNRGLDIPAALKTKVLG